MSRRIVIACGDNRVGIGFIKKAIEESIVEVGRFRRWEGQVSKISPETRRSSTLCFLDCIQEASQGIVCVRQVGNVRGVVVRYANRQCV